MRLTALSPYFGNHPYSYSRFSISSTPVTTLDCTQLAIQVYLPVLHHHLLLGPPKKIRKRRDSANLTPSFSWKEQLTSDYKLLAVNHSSYNSTYGKIHEGLSIGSSAHPLPTAGKTSSRKTL